MVGPVCRTCIGLGLLVSALVHGLTLALLLHLRPPPPSLPELRAVDLTLADFAPVAGSGDGPSAEATPIADASATASAAAAGPAAPPNVTVPRQAHAESRPNGKPQVAGSADPAPSPASLLHAEAPPPTKARAAHRDTAPMPKPKTERPKAKPKRSPKSVADRRPKPASAPSTRPPSARVPADRSLAALAPPPERVRPPKRATAKPATRPGPRVETQASHDGRGGSGKTASGAGSKRPGGASATPSVQSGASSAASRARAERAYLAELQRAIARQQRFPEEARRRRTTGIATLAFAVVGDGRITQVRIAKSSGDAALDRAAMQALSRLGRFKPIPAAIGRSHWPMRVPIRFDLR